MSNSIILAEDKAVEIIKNNVTKTNIQPNNNSDEDHESSDSDHYYDQLANPKKVVSKKDLHIKSQDKKISSCLTNFIKLNSKNCKLENKITSLEEETIALKKSNNSLASSNDFASRSIRFLNCNFYTDNLTLDTSTPKSIDKFKENVLDKAIEMSEFKIAWESLINCKDVSEDLKNYFIPLINEKYNKLKLDYTSEIEKTNGKYFIFLAVLFLVFALCFPHIFKYI